MRLEGFFSLLACLALLGGIVWAFTSLHEHTRESVAAAGQSRSSP
ncbi:MAG: hypothetical protein ACT4QA_06040 [Panacagrimonas sp.]